MADVKWIKIVTDIFDDEKMLLIDGLPERDAIIVIWFKLLCLAGKQNNGGVFMLNDKIAYTDEMLATILRRPLNTVRLALKTFDVLGCSGVIRIDFMIDNDTNEIFVNEVNTIPGSLSFHLWKATDLNYTKLLDELIDLALKRNREEKNITYSFDSNILSDVSMKSLKGGTKLK